MNTPLTIALLTGVRDNFLHGRKADSPVKEPVLFICWELVYVQFEAHHFGFEVTDDDLKEAAEVLSNYVSAALVDTRGLRHASLGGWVRAVVNPEGFLNSGVAALCRLAWLDRMIHELQHEGKLP